jgi:NAD(P)-dependent dehydrogenase (short-subunit alcohol dehydrogenase family)
MSSIKTKNALVTGAARRIGRDIALALANNGWNVAVHHNSTSADEVTNEIKKLGVKAIAIKADLDNPGDTKKLIAKAKAELGEINLLVNNASIFEKVSFKDTSEDVFDRHMNIHLKAPFFLAQEFATQTSNGQIINIVDSKVTKNRTAYFAYLLSKKSLADLTRMLAVELAPNIRVNAILPGLTELSDEVDQEYINKRVSQLPLQRKVATSEITDALLYLANSGAHTGQSLYLDSGENLL